MNQLGDDPAEMAKTLEQHADYRVLRRLRFRDEFTPAGGNPTRIGVLLDVETTGLDTTFDEIIELGIRSSSLSLVS